MRRLHCPSPWLLAVMLLLGLARPASAEVFCVNSVAGLNTALAIAEINGQDDEIRIVQGTYVGNFGYSGFDANNLSVLGGYTTGCASRTLDPANTILDGNQTGSVLTLWGPDGIAEFLVEGLTLRNGNTGGLTAQVGTNGKVVVAKNVITGNTASYYYGGGVYLNAGTATLTDNHISGNTSHDYGGGMYLSVTTATLTSNIISGNTAYSYSNFYSITYGGGIYLKATTATLTDNDIRGNTASSSSTYESYGGGLYLGATTATLTDNRISDNTISASSYSKGGGIYLINATTATLSNNSISGNTASSTYESYGGGLYLGATTATLTDNHISDNTLSASTYQSYGGGLYLSTNDITLTNNDITDNTTFSSEEFSYGGGLYLKAATTATLTDNHITGNTSGFMGGGIFLHNATTATLTNNDITGNSASSNYDSSGGGVHLSAKTTALTNNHITGNTSGFFGGGVDLFATTATLTNNNITGNTASANYDSSYSSGGGVFLSAKTATLTNNTLAVNTASAGGGLYLWLWDNEATDMAWLYNNLFWANVATDNQGADLWFNNDGDDDSLPNPVTLLTNNFDWSASGFKITLPITIDPSNLNKVDPLFVDASTGDLHLQPGSPMIDAGYLGAPDLPDFDIDGTPRVLGSSVDIGAYEFDDGSDPKAILTLTLAGNGSGTVTSNPTGIDCGTDCLQAYNLDTLVTLTATPADANSTFTGWSGAADCADGQVTMSTNMACTATFMAQRWLTVTRAGQGKGRITSVPAGIDCGTACQAPFALGTTVKLTAIPDALSTFAGWSGAGCPNPKLNLNRSCRATFNLKRFSLYTFVVGTGGGQVTSNPAGIRCGADCEQEYVANTLVTLRAVPNALSRFTGWAGPCTGTAPTCKVRMSQVRGVAAIFDLKN